MFEEQIEFYGHIPELQKMVEEYKELEKQLELLTKKYNENHNHLEAIQAFLRLNTDICPIHNEKVDISQLIQRKELLKQEENQIHSYAKGLHNKMDKLHQRIIRYPIED